MNSTEQNEPDEQLAIVKSAVARLSEHFETVQIFCTKLNDSGKGTTHVQWGSGNWFARYGQVKTWSEKEEEDLRIEVRKHREQE